MAYFDTPGALTISVHQMGMSHVHIHYADMIVQGCGSESLQGDVRFAEVMGLMGASVQWSPYSITIRGVIIIVSR